MKTIKRQEFLNNCLNLLNAPYHPFGRDEHGIDCVGLPIFGMKKSGIDLPDLDTYSHVGDGFTLSKILSEIGRQKNINEIKIGDILSMKFSRHPQHVAIYAGDYYKNGEQYILHSYALSDKVVLENLRDWISGNRIVAVYEFKNFED